MPKKIVVCGATGFIGRNMAEHFAKNSDYEVYATHHRSVPFSNSKIKWIRADLTNPSDVKNLLRGTDILIQAAATTSGAKDIVNKPYYHVTDNAVMNSLIFREAFEQKIGHVVFFSCTVMYPSSDTPLKETDFDANREFHKNYFGVGWTKVYLEKMAEFYSRLGMNKFTILRHSNIYGPWDKYDLERSHVFGATVTKVMSASQGKITVWGDGSEGRDLLYISDLVNFVQLSIEKQKTSYELTNVGLGAAISVKDLVQKLIHASGRPLTIEYDSTKPSLKTKLCLDVSKALRTVGWTPKVSLEEGVRMTLDWYREHIDPKTGYPVTAPMQGVAA